MKNNGLQLHITRDIWLAKARLNPSLRSGLRIVRKRNMKQQFK